VRTVWWRCCMDAKSENGRRRSANRTYAPRRTTKTHQAKSPDAVSMKLEARLEGAKGSASAHIFQTNRVVLVKGRWWVAVFAVAGRAERPVLSRKWAAMGFLRARVPAQHLRPPVEGRCWKHVYRVQASE